MDKKCRLTATTLTLHSIDVSTRSLERPEVNIIEDDDEKIKKLSEKIFQLKTQEIQRLNKFKN